MTTTYLWTPPAISSLSVRGCPQRLPINRLFFVGRNYHAHAVEMGWPVDKRVKRPFYFTKSPSTLVELGATAAYPPQTTNYHHEMELVVAIGAGGVNIPEADALMKHVWGYAVGLDMTRRDVQNVARKAGRPWDMGKGFDHSAPISDIVPAKKIGHPDKGLIELKVNGVVRQSSDLAKMIWNIPETIAYLSRLVRLMPGDLIYTGTPEGVAAVVRGDVMEGTVEGVASIRTKIV